MLQKNRAYQQTQITLLFQLNIPISCQFVTKGYLPIYLNYLDIFIGTLPIDFKSNLSFHCIQTKDIHSTVTLNFVLYIIYLSKRLWFYNLKTLFLLLKLKPTTRVNIMIRQTCSPLFFFNA